MLDDIETKGYGLPYLGIKPTAVGVAPIPQMQPVQQMPYVNPAVHMPSPVKVPTTSNPARISTPLPLSKPQVPVAPEPLKTTQRPMSNVQLVQPAQKMPQMFMGNINNEYEDKPELPPILQPIQQLPQQPKMKFNQLTGLLNKGNQK